MDAPRGLNEQDADKLLRDLFQNAGALTAPEGLDARVLQRIAVSPNTSLVADKPLVPTWAWVAAGALLVGLAFLPGDNASMQWMGRLPAFSWEKILSSPRLKMGLITCTAFLGLDAWLNSRRLAHQPR
jgi:hypothetical protein